MQIFSRGSSANPCILLRNILLLNSYISGEVRNSLYYIGGTQNKSDTQPVRCVADVAFASKDVLVQFRNRCCHRRNNVLREVVKLWCSDAKCDY